MGGKQVKKYLSPRLPLLALTAMSAGGALGLLGAPQATAAADPTADLSITKFGPTPTQDGRLGYQITVRNNGPEASSGWTLTDPMNGHTIADAPADIRSSDPRCRVIALGYHGGVPQKALECQGGPLAVGASTVIEITALPGPYGTTNRARITGNEPDSISDNNVAVSDVPMINPAIGAAAAVVLGVGGTALIRRRRATGGAMI